MDRRALHSRHLFPLSKFQILGGIPTAFTFHPAFGLLQVQAAIDPAADRAGNVIIHHHHDVPYRDPHLIHQARLCHLGVHVQQYLLQQLLPRSFSIFPGGLKQLFIFSVSRLVKIFIWNEPQRS